MSYYYLLFDLDNTLFDFDLAQDQALEILLTQEGVPKQQINDYKAYYVPLNQFLWEQLESKKISRQELVNSRFSLLFEHFGHKKDGQELAQVYQKALCQQGQLLDGAVDLLKTCLSKGKRLFAISNGISKIQRSRLKVSGLNQYFEEIFISEEIGQVKPDRAFFDTVRSKIQAFSDPDAVVIGDSLSADIKGANQSGLDSIWFNLQNKKADMAIKATYQAKNYQELLELII